MTNLKNAMDRRRWLLMAAAGAVGTVVPLVGWTGDDGDDDSVEGGNVTVVPANTGLTGNIVVVGGGMAGTTAAKYLRLWGGAGLNITLVEPNAGYTSNIMSNLVLNGSRTTNSLVYGYAGLTSKYDIVVKQASVTALDAVNRVLTLSDSTSLPYDRLVVAPGVEFEDAYGLTQTDYDGDFPHAWQAGPQTTALAQQIAGMQNGDTFVMTIPKSPYRCPPGPYERACLVADYLKTRFGVGTSSKVVVLDENASIQAEVHNFTTAFNVTHAGVVQYVAGVTDIAIDRATKTVTYKDGVGNPQTITTPRVVSPIVPHRARGSSSGGWLDQAWLNNSADGKWCTVDVLTYESTKVAGVHVLGDAANCGLPKAGHVANQEAKICADAIVRLLGGGQPDPAPVANSACYSPITATTASWLTAVYQYDPVNRKMVVTANGGQTAGATAIEAGSVSASNFQQMNTWFNTLMSDTFA